MITPYLQALRKEIELVSDHIDRRRPVTQLHFGGGTPNSIDAGLLRTLNEFLFDRFNFIENPEIAIECNPAYLDYKYIDELRAAKFNRFSLGIQDFNETILRRVNRDPSAIPPADLFAYLKGKGQDVKVNLDFIYGLPGQTVESFAKTIAEAAEIRPDRLVTFSYAHVPWLKKHQLILEKAGLPAPEIKMQMFLEAYNYLKKSGYQPIGLDHFVLPDDDLGIARKEHTLHRNFQGYCTRRTTGQVYAFGVTAISQLEKGYSQNVKSIKEYIASVENGKLPVERGCHLTDDDTVTRTIINELMCNMKINYREIAELHGLSTEELKTKVSPDESTMKSFESDGLIRYSSEEIKITETGSFFIRYIAASFDRQFKQAGQTYSRTV
jgi:oxygen-independent coproporphyrinogen-3 oxidase